MNRTKALALLSILGVIGSVLGLRWTHNGFWFFAFLTCLALVVLFSMDVASQSPSFPAMALKRISGAVLLLAGIGLFGWFIYAEFIARARTCCDKLAIGMLVVPLFFVIAGWRGLQHDGPGIEDLAPGFQCDELTQSVFQAQAQLNYFIDQVEKNADGAYIKFPITTPNGLIEHIWGYVHSYRADKFNVSLVNQPYDDAEPANGRRDVAVTDVEDWQIGLPDGQIKGAYSLIALFLYRAHRGLTLSSKMRKQLNQLLDFPHAN